MRLFFILQGSSRSLSIVSAPGTLRSRVRLTPHRAMTNDEILV
jgi:hypothetical protein